MYHNRSEVQDLSNYRFYALGLHSGVSIDQELVISGSLTRLDDLWKTLSMDLSIVVSRTDVPFSTTVDCTLGYSIDPVLVPMSYAIEDNHDTIIDSNGAGRIATVFKGDYVTLDVRYGTSADIRFQGTAGMREARIASGQFQESSAIIDTRVSGTYSLTLTKEGCGTSYMILNVFEKMESSCDVYVSCRP